MCEGRSRRCIGLWLLGMKRICWSLLAGTPSPGQKTRLQLAVDVGGSLQQSLRADGGILRMNGIVPPSSRK